MVFAPANPEALFREAAHGLGDALSLLEQLDRERGTFERYTEAANAQMLMAIYQQAIIVSQGREGA